MISNRSSSLHDRENRLQPPIRVSDELLGFVLDELLVDPAPAVVAAPYLAPQQPPGDRAPRHHDCPEMPGVRPGPFGIERCDLRQIVTNHRTQLRHSVSVAPIKCDDTLMPRPFRDAGKLTPPWRPQVCAEARTLRGISARNLRSEPAMRTC